MTEHNQGQAKVPIIKVGAELFEVLGRTYHPNQITIDGLRVDHYKFDDIGFQRYFTIETMSVYQDKVIIRQ